MNSCTFYGRISTDIELRYTQDQTAISTFNIAINRKQKDQVDFLPFTAFGKTAENIEKYFHKGSRIVVKTSARRNEYTDKDGKKRSSISFIIEEFDFVESKSENTSNPTQTITDSDGFMNIPEGISEELPFN